MSIEDKTKRAIEESLRKNKKGMRDPDWWLVPKFFGMNYATLCGYALFTALFGIVAVSSKQLPVTFICYVIYFPTLTFCTYLSHKSGQNVGHADMMKEINAWVEEIEASHAMNRTISDPWDRLVTRLKSVRTRNWRNEERREKLPDIGYDRIKR